MDDIKQPPVEERLKEVTSNAPVNAILQLYFTNQDAKPHLALAALFKPSVNEELLAMVVSVADDEELCAELATHYLNAS
ncbi:MAG: hypothetical protein FWC79_07610 [Oscillospiraceae bacterium]|nr:hypothetical protein [Oscillospiraceae bacterium]